MHNPFAVLFFSILSVVSFGQSFELVPFDSTQVNSEKNGILFKETLYRYLRANYETVSEKKGVKEYSHPENGICAFQQEFSHQISYSIEMCHESEGMLVRLTLPKTDLNALKAWVEAIMEYYNFEDEYGWSKDQLIYGPLEEGIGCYFRLKPIEKFIEIEHYCGG